MDWGGEHPRVRFHPDCDSNNLFPIIWGSWVGPALCGFAFVDIQD